MKKSSGLTLIESVIVVALLSIILAAGSPSFSNLIERRTVPQIAKLLEKSIQVARSEASTRSSRVDLEPINVNWANGWQITWDSAGTTETIHAFPDTFPTASIVYSAAVPIEFEANGQIGTVGTFTVTQLNGVSNCTVTLQVLISGLVQKRSNQC